MNNDLFFIENSPFYARLDGDHFELLEFQCNKVRLRAQIQGEWKEEATQAANELKKTLWWRMAYRGSEAYYGPYYSKEEAIEASKNHGEDYTYLTQADETAWVLPADFFDKNFLEHQFLESLTEDWNEQGPVEDTWVDFWGQSLDLKAMAEAMANAMRQEIVRQGLRPYGIVSEGKVIGPIDPKTGEDWING